MGVYETIGKPGTAQATVRPGQPVYSSLGTPTADKKTKTSSTMEGTQRRTEAQQNITSTTVTENSKKIPAIYSSVIKAEMRRKVSTTSETIPQEADATPNMYKGTMPPPIHSKAKQEEGRSFEPSLTHLSSNELLKCEVVDPATLAAASVTKENTAISWTTSNQCRAERMPATLRKITTPHSPQRTPYQRIASATHMSHCMTSPGQHRLHCHQVISLYTAP
jgi:hypothetical protein